MKQEFLNLLITEAQDSVDRLLNSERAKYEKTIREKEAIIDEKEAVIGEKDIIIENFRIEIERLKTLLEQKNTNE